MAGRSAKAGDACCSALDAVLTADDYEPCFTVDDDGVLCLTVGITDIDEAVVKILRRAGKPVILAANKVDDLRGEAEAALLRSSAW